MRVKDRVCIGDGKNCRHCKVTMQRFVHSPDWKPSPDKGHYRFWDKCPKCKRQFMYQKAYVKPQENDFDLIERN